MGAILLLAGTSSLQNAVANGDTRTLSFHHTHSGESGTFTFKKDGRYDPEVLDKLNYFLRDWRNQKSTKMDPHLFDILWEVCREVDAKEPIQIISSYRSPETNSLLRSRSRGVAKFSQHMLGKAIDFFIPGVKLSDLRVAGLRLQRGGVGFYPTSGSPFVHMDTGSIRHWPRMTHDQLARVFPDGKTVHIPADGKPLSHYAQALAEVHERGKKPGVEVASAYSGKSVKEFISGFIGKKSGGDEEETTVASADDEKSSGEETTATPLPEARPVEVARAAIVTAQLASAPMPLRRPDRLGHGRGEAPLPSLITQGTPRESDTALGYASVGDVAASQATRRVASLGPLAPASLSVTDRAPPSAVTRLRERGKPQGAIAFTRLFLSPSLSSELFLLEPELRVFKAFVAPPRMVVAYTFSRDATFGLKSTSFSGPAVVELPTYAFRAPPVTLTQRF